MKLITNVQALRAFAAAFVVLFHTQYRIVGAVSSYFGVELFFCISGFVMSYVSRAEGASIFLRARLIRVVPLYWLATILFFLWTHLGLSNPPYVWPLWWKWLWTQPSQIGVWSASNVVMDAGTWSSILKSLFFIPYVDSTGGVFPVLGVGWTLNLEIFFYLLFAAALAIHRGLAPVLVAAALLACRFLLEGSGPALSFYAKQQLDFFIFGILCYYAWAALGASQASANRARAVLLACAGAAAYLWSGWWTELPGNTAKPLAGFLAQAVPPMMLFVALWCEHQGLRVRNAFMLELGAASYALYLFHPFVIETMRPVGAAWPWAATNTSIAGLALSVLLSLALTLAVYRGLERPLTRFLKKRFVSRAGEPDALTVAAGAP